VVRTPLRIAGIVLVFLVAAIVLATAVVYAASTVKLHHRYALPTHSPFVAPTDPVAIARGEHLVKAIGKCAKCHGSDLSGAVFIDGGQAFGVFVAPNLTRGAGGLPSDWTDADYELALRHGITRDGHGLVFMPSKEMSSFSDEDLGALVAYLKHVPPVDHMPPATHLGPIARMLFVAGQLPLIDADKIDQSAPHKPAPPPGPTATYGAYIANIGGCTGCHGPGLSGGHIPGTPANFKSPANLTPAGIGSWTSADFMRALREGVRPGGVQIDTFMPWQYTRSMTDDEINAVFAYLKTVPSRPFGQR